MPITIGTKPGSNYNDPLGLLSDCHRRIERFLELLATVTRQASGGELNGEQREATETALRYFRNAAPKHTADEEESLFPRLRSATGGAAVEALALLDRLHDDHQAAEEMHGEVHDLVAQWLEEGELSTGRTLRLAALLEDLSAIYRQHIAVEEGQLFPLAERALPQAEVTQIGREMAARRGIDLSRETDQGRRKD